MIAMEQHPHGVVLPVWVQAHARHSGIRGEHAGYLKVAVTAPPEKGKANQAVVALLAEQLGVPAARITVLAGATQPRKRILLCGCTPQDVARRLEQRIPPTKS